LGAAVLERLNSKPNPQTVMSAPQINGKKPLSGPNDPVKPSDQELTMVARPSRHQNTFKMRSNISGNTEHLVPKFLFAAPAFFALTCLLRKQSLYQPAHNKQSSV
jgi:hypothetical protein